MIPACPIHGVTHMRDMASVGASDWYTCAFGAERGAPCGKSAHAVPEDCGCRARVIDGRPEIVYCDAHREHVDA